jgi:hypothetical protein
VALCLFAPYTKFQVTTNVNGANSTKPLLCAGRFISTKFNLKTMDNLKDLLEEFIDWARDCGEDAFYIFENTDEAIEKFFEQRDE